MILTKYTNNGLRIFYIRPVTMTRTYRKTGYY